MLRPVVMISLRVVVEETTSHYGESETGLKYDCCDSSLCTLQNTNSALKVKIDHLF